VTDRPDLSASADRRDDTPPSSGSFVGELGPASEPVAVPAAVDHDAPEGTRDADGAGDADRATDRADHAASAGPAERLVGWVSSASGWVRDNSATICLSLTLVGVAMFTALFGSLAVVNHRNFGTWAFDGAIYDQAIWLVSRGGQTFMTVRGMDVWGHHVNLVFYLFAPFYRFGAGPELLFVVQNFTIALAALPVYLVARDRFARPSVGLLFAFAYLMYAPIQWISWINFHPEALVIAPFMFAWYFATKKRWTWFFVSVSFVLIMREDAALAVIMLGIVLLVTNWRSVTRRRDLKVAVATVMVGVVWYALATQVVIPHFNSGGEAFYLKYFFGRYGGSLTGIAENVIRHPDRVISDAMQGDRTRFYRQLGLPLGGFAILSPLHLLMLAPQMLASVIGDQVYARSIMYQYPSIMIAPMMIASIEGAHRLWRRFRFMKWALHVWLLVAVYVSNVAWSNSPLSANYIVWQRGNPRADALQEAVDMVPDDAVVTSSYGLGPHLSRRAGSYDWPNPFWPAYWGNEIPGSPDCTRFPSASVVDYLVLDLNLFPPGDSNRIFIDALIAEDQFEPVFEEENVLVARRVTPGPDGEAVAVNCPVVPGQGHLSALALIGADVAELTVPTAPAPPPVTGPTPATTTPGSSPTGSSTVPGVPG